MHPFGFGMPPILAASFAGPLGKSWYSSFTGTPDSLPSERIVGATPVARYRSRMKRTTCQWRGVSSAMPASSAMPSAISSFHCSGCVRKPSASTSTALSAISTVISSSFSYSRRDSLARGRHLRPDERQLPPRQQHVPVEPLEHELAEMVEPRLPQQRERAGRRRESSRPRLLVVVEVDQERLLEPGLDEAVGVPVEARDQVASGEEALDVLAQHLALEMGDGAGLRARQVGRVAEREHVRRGVRLERALVGRHEAERVAEPL